jgi:murein DD-endopeptidase MepM/ murein hydrolase activator NlpD
MTKRLMGIWLAAAGLLCAEKLDLVLPTENRHLFSGEPEKFYMYVDRNFEGETSKPWEGGSFGFTRTPMRIKDRVVMTKFHEGIDVSPLQRDKAGNPLDPIRSISKGKVVHVSSISGRSNYGKYLVVEHEWEGSKVYSLYAHLAEISVAIGQNVEAGSVIARMGYTGAGLNRTRAHLHLELCFLMSQNYEAWHKQNFGSPNYHGNFNGMNLAGVDLGALYLAHHKSPELSFSEFLSQVPVHFKVTIPAKSQEPDFLKRHSWMKRKELSGEASWEIGFAATGHIVSFTPRQRKVQAATLSHIRPSDIPHRWPTRGLLTGEGSQASIAHSGKQMLSLALDDVSIR